MSDVTEPTSLADIALRRAERDPATPFVLTIDEEEPYVVRTRSYGQIVARAALLSDALREAGVQPGARVGCYLPNSPSWVVTSLGVWCARAAVAAVGTLLPGVEAARLFDLADVAAVVTVSDAPELPGNHVVLRLDAEGLLEGGTDPGDTEWDPTDLTLPAPEDLAVALFTSGTTGQPKGITHTHSDIVATSRRVAAGYARTSDYRPGPAPAHLAPGVVFNPFGHMTGFSRIGFRMWIGRPTVIVPRFTVAAVGALLALRDGCVAAHAHDDPHVGHDGSPARPEGREVRDVGHRAPVDRHPRAVRSALRGSGHAGVRHERGRRGRAGALRRCRRRPAWTRFGRADRGGRRGQDPPPRRRSPTRRG